MMINDGHGILLGLYRESSFCEILEESEFQMTKRFDLNGRTYIVKETSLDGDFSWKVFDKEHEMTNEEIEEMYAEANLRRVLRHKK